MAESAPLISGSGGDSSPSFFSDPCGAFQQWFCSNPFDNCTIVAVASLGIAPLYIVPIVGGLTLAFAANRVWALRNLAAEIDRFQVENERLEVTQERLNGEVETLTAKKEELTKHVTKLGGTVTEIQGVSEGLQNELEQFQSLKGNIEKFGAETGKDVRKILGEAQKIHSKMERMTNQNERALLGKIAQDVEFLDKGAGMQKPEFEDFFSRMPKHLQNRFRALGLTFEAVAGDDGVIDFMEIEGMINKLMAETEEKINSIQT